MLDQTVGFFEKHGFHLHKLKLKKPNSINDADIDAAAEEVCRVIEAGAQAKAIDIARITWRVAERIHARGNHRDIYKNLRTEIPELLGVVEDIDKRHKKNTLILSIAQGVAFVAASALAYFL